MCEGKESTMHSKLIKSFIKVPGIKRVGSCWYLWKGVHGPLDGVAGEARDGIEGVGNQLGSPRKKIVGKSSIKMLVCI